MKIVVLDGYTLNPGDISWGPVEGLGEVTIHPRTASDQILERSTGAEILLTNKTPLSRESLDQLPDVKFISCMATGFNVIAVDAAREKNIPVSNVPVYSTQSVAQHVFAVLLAWTHRPFAHHEAIQSGQWQSSGEFSFTLKPLRELAGKTFGIIGHGRIGEAVGRLANAMGMKVVAYRRTPTDPPGYEGFEWCSLEETVSRADVLSLHCPQTESTAGMVDRELLCQMKSSAILINTGRGGLVNETDLARALDEHDIAGACLDVLTAEPVVASNPLLNAKNCLLTPHIAWNTVEARTRLMQTTADNIAAFQKGTPINVVN